MTGPGIGLASRAPASQPAGGDDEELPPGVGVAATREPGDLLRLLWAVP